MQLAVMLSTCCEHYTGATPLTVYIVDGGLTAYQRSRVEASLPAGRMALRWRPPNELPVEDVFLSNHITISTYYRLFLPELIPASVDRVVYIDVDTAVLGDIDQLFQMNLQDNVVLARRQAAPAGWTLSPSENYFNAGVLVIDAPKWRRERVSERAFDFATRYGAQNTEWDQGALNAVLSYKWGELPDSWNTEPVPAVVGMVLDGNQRVGVDILHFLGVAKPWHSDCHDRQLQDFYLSLVDRTAWKGWRPPKGVESMLRTLSRLPSIAFFLSATRKLRARLGLNYSNLYRYFRDRSA